jgi:hypothetical protein
MRQLRILAGVILASMIGGASLAVQPVTLAPSDLSSVRIRPNPWRSDKNGSIPMTFDQLGVNSTVKIFTVSGRFVKALPVSSTSVSWDLTNDSGEKVASGVYLYQITSDQDKKTGQLVVIK